jgi:hypothetical protein
MIFIVKETLVELILGQRALKIWVFVADIRDDFIMGLDILRPYDASVDVGHHVLRLGQEEVPVSEAPTASALTRSRSTKSHRTGGRDVGNAVAPVISRRVLTEDCQEYGRETRLEEGLCNWRERQRE